MPDRRSSQPESSRTQPDSSSRSSGPGYLNSYEAYTANNRLLPRTRDFERILNADDDNGKDLIINDLVMLQCIFTQI